jgi:prepilin-type N-terminal cleavage/methylation domain-containing protein
MARRRPSPARPAHVPAIARSGERGFTLLELMISMTLLVMMVAMTYSMFATTLRMVPRGEGEAERSARLRGATDMISRQIRSTVNYPAKSEGESFPFFQGAPYWFTFITAAPQHRGGEGLGYVTYWSDGHSLNVGERVIFSASSILGDTPEVADQSMLLDGFTASRFQYLRLDGGDSEWRDDWDGREEQNLPAAIRIVLEGVGSIGSSWVQEIPIMTVAYGLGSYDPDQEQNAGGEEEGEDMNGPGANESLGGGRRNADFGND